MSRVLSSVTFIFTISSLIQGLAEVLVHYPGDLAHVVGVEDHVPGEVLGGPLELLLPVTLPLLLAGGPGGEGRPGVRRPAAPRRAPVVRPGGGGVARLVEVGETQPGDLLAGQLPLQLVLLKQEAGLVSSPQKIDSDH